VIVHEVVRTWTEVLESRLAEIHPPEEAHRLALRWGAAFSAEYQASSDADEAAEDLAVIERMEQEDRRIDVRLSNRALNGADGEPENFTWLNVYVRGERLVLSEFMPILEGLGLRVLSMQPYDATDDEGGAYINTFSVQDQGLRSLDPETRGALLTEAILAV